MLPLRRAAAALLLLGAACETLAPGPRSSLPVLVPGTPLEGRVDPGASAEHELAPITVPFRLLLQARSGRAADTLVAELVGPRGEVVGRARSVGTDASLHGQASEWLSLPSGRGWRVRVRGVTSASAGPFTLALYPHDPAPERHPPTIAVGETIEGEDLDFPGDVDEFLVEGAAGAEWIVFAQSFSAPDTEMTLELVDRASGTVLARTFFWSGAEELHEHSTGRVVLTRAGTYLVRISGRDDPLQAVSGPYRFRVERVDRAPESGSPVLAMGAVVAEEIGSVGDVDEFTFAGVAGEEINLLVQLEAGMAGGLVVELLHAGASIARVVVDTPAPTLDEAGTGRVTLPASGPYTVRVSGPASGRADWATGGYRLEVYPVSRLPESGGVLRLDGPPVSDAIERPGDLDEFEFSGTEGEFVVIHVEPTAPPKGRLVAEVIGPDGSRLSLVEVGTGGRRHGRRLRLPATATYRLQVGGHWAGSFATGAYSAGAYRVSPAPEHAPAALRIGDTVHDRIDRPGDLDVYTLRGEAGREVIVFFGADAPGGSMHLSFAPEGHPAPYIFAAAGEPTLDAASTGRITLADTTYRIVVDPQMAVGIEGYAETGGYSLRVFPVDRRPEGRPAAYVLGDTVRGEPLYPSGDIDEYTFEVGAPTPLRVEWSTTPADEHSVIGILREEETGSQVWSSATYDADGRLVRQVTLPRGRYRFSVLDPHMVAPRNHQGSGPARVEYRFAFIP